MVQLTKDRIGDDVSDSLDWTSVRCILAERNVRSRLIVVACEFRQQTECGSRCGQHDVTNGVRKANGHRQAVVVTAVLGLR